MNEIMTKTSVKLHFHPGNGDGSLYVSMEMILNLEAKQCLLKFLFGEHCGCKNSFLEMFPASKERAKKMLEEWSDIILDFSLSQWFPTAKHHKKKDNPDKWSFAVFMIVPKAQIKALGRHHLRNVIESDDNQLIFSTKHFSMEVIKQKIARWLPDFSFEFAS